MSSTKLRVSARMAAVQEPIIPTIAQLISENPGTISLGQGIVYYGPPRSAIDHLIKVNSSLDNHIYGPVQGMPELINSIANKLEMENKITIRNDNHILVTAGSNMAFINALFAITDPGNEIILSVPYYFNHEMAITMMNCKAMLVPTDNNYQLCIDKIKAAINTRTRAIVTVSPNNPTGAVYPEKVLREINTICQEHNIYHISDEAYEYFIYDENQHFSPASIPGSADHTISLFSLSKSYGLASWRIGYMVIPDHLHNAVTKAQDTNLICPSTASQYVALGAMKAGSNYCRNKIEKIADVRNVMLNELKHIDTFCTIPVSDGAFYILMRLRTGIDDMDVVCRLIQEHKIAVIPGHTFGMIDGCYLRVAFGALEKDLATEGIRRLTNGLRSIMEH